jgi:hypothetical protein
MSQRCHEHGTKGSNFSYAATSLCPGGLHYFVTKNLIYDKEEKNMFILSASQTCFLLFRKPNFSKHLFLNDEYNFYSLLFCL